MHWLIPLSVALALLATVYLVLQLLRQDRGTAQMQAIAAAIREGAFAYLARQYRTIALLSVPIAALLFFLFPAGPHTAAAFLVGAAASGLSGFIGMWTAVTANLRVAAAARASLAGALATALRGGAVTGLAVTALSLGGVAGLFYLYGGAADPARATQLIIGFGFGASFVALFAQLGGGIYTKAADVGADLVGKVEAGIPEDDPRNPAVIADLVGDNVGDCAGRGADLFESTAAENIGAMILGIALLPVFGVQAILFPLVARSVGLIASLAGIFAVRVRGEDESPMAALNRGYLVTSVLVAGGLWWVTAGLLRAPGVSYLHFYGCALIGLALSYLFVWITQYYTEYTYRPVLRIAGASVTGPATNVITGVAVGFESVAAPALAVAASLLGAYYLGETSGLAGGGLYGTAIATMGMLSTVTYVLAMDTYGPITDNAGGIAVMSGAPEQVRERTDRLDASGNTTKALTKGYAVGSAALAAFLLFSAYTDEVKRLTAVHTFPVDLGRVDVFIGALIGTMLVYLFSGTAIKAVGKTAGVVILEVRRQLAADPGILAGTARPSYARCVDIVTAAALRQMVLPGSLVVLTPILLGMILGAEAVAGFLQVGTIAGVVLALFLNTAGGAWDNAKKHIETGAHQGKGSEAHKAAVVGDTVGDPFKDTAGPSLHVLVKLISTVALVAVSLFV